MQHPICMQHCNHVLSTRSELCMIWVHSPCCSIYDQRKRALGYDLSRRSVPFFPFRPS